ncbi:glycosyltransferase family protein [Kocuria carniphila]|uniref:glycosyltransferase family protein n=1 Tax=Kocuria carniphila TaxID=262208 RepID=UPI00101DCC95|nr:glycosyltransferase [Kocuria carniphila]MCT1802536.1 glycosyltransferase [Kocuria carniphila]
MKTLVLFEGDFRQGPYGIDLLPDLGFELSGVQPLQGRLPRKLRDVIEHRTSTKIDVPVRSIPKAQRADLILGLLEPNSKFAAQLKRRGIPPYAGTPMVMISCWLAEWISKANPEDRRALVRQFEAVDLILTLSRNQIEILIDAGFRPEQVDAIPFGCAPELFDGEDVERDIDVLAAGFDHGRDYGTFFDGVGDLDVTVHVLCQPANLAGLTVPDNVVVHGVVPFDQYRAMLRRAKIVAVPTEELAYPTGQSVALEAAASGAAVAYTATTALSEYFDASYAAPVSVGDSKGWQRVIGHLVESSSEREALASAGRAKITEDFSYANMWRAFKTKLSEHGITP